MNKFLVALGAFVVTAVAVIALAQSGGPSSNSASPAQVANTSTTTTTAATTTAAAATVAVSASPSALAFDKTAITVSGGKVTFDFNNPAPLQHNFSIRAADGSVVGASETVTSKAAAPFTVNLKAGTYSFFCSVPGHEAAGMTGTLTVK
jgi:Copper binding proteins, plastocyanin/azurin family.